MEIQTTCGRCNKLKFSNMSGTALAYCGAVNGEFIVPHEGELIDGYGGDTKVTLWRVPKFCPKTDNETLKSDTQAPKKDWVTLFINAKSIKGE